MKPTNTEDTPIDITERYKLIFAEHHYASDYRVKLFTGWCAIYAALAAAFAWADKAHKPLTWIVTVAGAAVTLVMWCADRRHRPALRASKEVGAAIEQSSIANIPPDQRFFTRLTPVERFFPRFALVSALIGLTFDRLFPRLKLSTWLKKFETFTHGLLIDIFSVATIVLLVLATFYLLSRNGELPK